MKKTFQILLGCVVLLGASASFAAQPADYCVTGWNSIKAYPGIGDGSLDFAAKMLAVAYCGSDKMVRRYESSPVISSLFTSKKTYAKLENELLNKMAADDLVEVLDVAPAAFSTETRVFTTSSNVLKPGESLCYVFEMDKTLIKCTPGSKVLLDLNEKYTAAAMARNGYSQVAPSIYRK